MIVSRYLTDIASASTASDIQLGSCVTEIGEGAFSGYTNITDVEFPESLATIGFWAFSGSSITSLNIPNSVTSIGASAFKNCSSLSKIDIESSSPPALGDDSVFDNTNNCPIYVPFASYSQYIAADKWNEYAPRIRYVGAPYKVKFVLSDGSESYVNCDSSTSAEKPSTMPSGIISTTFGECTETIKFGGFSKTNLGDLIFSPSVKIIDVGAFSGGTTVNSITFAEGLEEIGNSAFSDIYNNNSVTFSINLPSTLKKIDYEAFDCDIITSATINGSSELELPSRVFSKNKLAILNVSNIKSIGTYSFAESNKLASVTLRNVKEINNGAFQYCSYLTDLYISTTSTTTIGDNAFGNCRSLTSVDIPNGVVSIGSNAFSNCRSLTSVDIPNGVVSIGSNAFSGCSSLANVTLPYTISNISDGVFSSCNKLETINIPNSITSIGNQSFGDCSSLASITIPNSVTSIGNGAFSGCTSLTSVTIGNSVTSIGSDAFNLCSGFTSVTIPNSVVNIGNNAFKNCINLNSITMNRVTPPTIGTGVFDASKCIIYVPQGSYDLYVNAENWSAYSNRIYAAGAKCKAYLKDLKVIACNSSTTLTSSEVKSGIYNYGVINAVDIGTCTEIIGSDAFNQCSGLTSVTIPNSVTSIGNRAFYGCSSLTSLTIPNSVTSIGNSAFNGCSSLRSVTIPNGVTNIGDYTFYNCGSLASIEIPNSVTSIDEKAFSNCTSLTSVTIGNSVTSIGNSAFSNCTNLTSVTIPNSVTSIGNYVFHHCGSLTSVTIGSGVTSIGSEAFQYCNKLTSIIVNATTPPTLGDNNVFDVTNNCPIYCPAQSVDAYKTADRWRYLADRIQAIPNS